MSRMNFLMPFGMIFHQTSRNKSKESSKTRILVIGHPPWQALAKALPGHWARHCQCTVQGTMQGTASALCQALGKALAHNIALPGKPSGQRTRNRFKLCTDVNNSTKNISTKFHAIFTRISIFLNFLVIKSREITKIRKIPK